jgi:hypothetical protein
VRHPARIVILALTLALVAPLAQASDPGQSSLPAKWVSRNVDFTYQGITTHYSCDALRDHALTILRALGAHWAEHAVQDTPCAAIGLAQISDSPGIRGTISVLVPATAEEVSRHDSGVVSAHWQPINLIGMKNLDTRRGAHCELLEQSARSLLPLFTTRNLDFSSNCIAHTTVVGNMTFKVDVLQVDRNPAVH